MSARPTPKPPFWTAPTATKPQRQLAIAVRDRLDLEQLIEQVEGDDNPRPSPR